MNRLTEVEAATAYARAWNRLDPTEFIELLAPDARYTSMQVLQDLEGQSAISDYLIGKMHTVKTLAVNDPEVKVFAELGKITKGSAGRDCVCMAQGHSDIIKGVVLFVVEGGKVKQVDLCIPQFLGVVRSSVYPI